MFGDWRKLSVNRCFPVRRRSVTLTKQGHAPHNFSTEIQNTLFRMEASLRSEQELGGELRFGASLTIASHVIPSFLAEFSRAYPRVEIELRVDNRFTAT